MEDLGIVPDLVQLPAPENEDGNPREYTQLERMRRAVGRKLYADDADVVSRFPGGFAKIVAVTEVVN